MQEDRMNREEEKADDAFGAPHTDETRRSGERLYPEKITVPQKRGWKFILIVALLAAAIVAGALVGGIYIGANTGIGADMPMLIESYKLLKKYYIEDITWSEFQALAAAGMAGSIDNFTWISAADEGSGLSKSMGVTIGSTTYNLHPISFIIPDSPAARATAIAYLDADGVRHENIAQDKKLAIGDLIYAVSVDGGEFVRVENADLSLLSGLIQNAGSETIGLRVRRYGYDAAGNYRMYDGLFEYRITMELLDKKYAWYASPAELGATDTAYIKLDQFHGTAPADFYDCVQQFLTDESRPEKLILDLRGNGGGAVDILAYIAKFLVKPDGAGKDVPVIRYDANVGYGKIETEYFYTSADYSNQRDNVYAQGAYYLGETYPGFRVSVLCDGGTASSSEALIGALEYYNGAQIVGGRTYGKGVGQQNFYVGGGKYILTVTNGYYYMPVAGAAGAEWTRNIHGKGITPGEGNNIGSSYAPLREDACVKRALEILAA